MPKRHFFRLLALVALLMPASANPPLWWADGHPPIITGTTENNKGPANIGQAKWMVSEALRALDATAPQIAADIRLDLTGTSPSNQIVDLTVPESKTPDWLEKQKAPLLIGQLKAIAAPFYTRLNIAAHDWLDHESSVEPEKGQLQINGTKDYGPGGSTNIYPWTAVISDDANKAPATIGQLKAVFSLRFEGLPPDFVDLDYDGMDDNWEIANGLDPSDYYDAYDDPDGDGIQNQYEYVLGFDPQNANTNGTPDTAEDRDADGMKDWQEAATGRFEWNDEQQKYLLVKVLDWEAADGNGDYDQDGLTNAQEFLHGTNANDYDSDNDYLPDGWEIQHNLVAAYHVQINGTWVYGADGANGRTGDPDGDGIQNQYEYVLGFDPQNANTGGIADSSKDRDADGMKDWQEAGTGKFKRIDGQDKYVFIKVLDWEVADGNGDYDQDGLANAQEFLHGTSFNDYDSDNDYLPDGWEIQHNLVAAESIQINGAGVYGSDGVNGRTGDPDGDGIQNQYEYVLGFDPQNANTIGTPDSAKDRDGDGMKDWQEAATGRFEWNFGQQKYLFVKVLDWEVADGNGDYDQDGLTNIQEFLRGTSFSNYDSDYDHDKGTGL
ncbi:MAG: hypothetical protein ABI162_04575 [Luteolibacter sp.]